MESLLIDPQTAGGLLAGVDADKADECVLKLRSSGYPTASIIGVVGDEEPGQVRLS